MPACPNSLISPVFTGAVIPAAIFALSSGQQFSCWTSVSNCSFPLPTLHPSVLQEKCRERHLQSPPSSNTGTLSPSRILVHLFWAIMSLFSWGGSSSSWLLCRKWRGCRLYLGIVGHWWWKRSEKTQSYWLVKEEQRQQCRIFLWRLQRCLNAVSALLQAGLSPNSVPQYSRGETGPNHSSSVSWLIRES